MNQNYTINSLKELIKDCQLKYPLNSCDKKVLVERLDNKSLKEIGINLYNEFENSRHNNLGVSTERTRQIEARAIRKIRWIFRNNEFVICAAIKDDYNRIIRGHRHHDCIRTLRDMPNGLERTFNQGFITSTNRFVERKEAMQIQIKAGLM